VQRQSPSANEDVAALYARAERLLSWNVNPLAVGASVQPQWLEGDRFWYRNRVADGHEFVVVDPARGTRERAFDHERMAAALTEATGRELQPAAPPPAGAGPTQDGRGLGFELDRRRWECDVVEYRCERPASPRRGGRRTPCLSPDGRWPPSVASTTSGSADMDHGEERRSPRTASSIRLRDGQRGLAESERPALIWSPDSRRIATYRLDERGVGEMHLLETTEGRPVLHSWPYAIPGDTVVPMYERVIIDVEDAPVVPTPRRRDHQRTSSCCGLMRGDAWRRGVERRWQQLRSTLLSRATTGPSRSASRRRNRGGANLILESLEPFFEGSAAGRGGSNWRVLHGATRSLVLAARRLGPPLPLRPEQRSAQAPPHRGRLECHRPDAGSMRPGGGSTSPAPAARRVAIPIIGTSTACA
jgi:dipeptidyl-peptidase 4